MGEIRVFYQDRFPCPAVSAELAGETIPLRDIIRVRNQRRRELSSVHLLLGRFRVSMGARPK